MRPAFAVEKTTSVSDRITETIVGKLNNPSTSSDFDFHAGLIKSWQMSGCQPQTAVDK
jgi:hypothetical protein